MKKIYWLEDELPGWVTILDFAEGLGIEVEPFEHQLTCVIVYVV